VSTQTFTPEQIEKAARMAVLGEDCEAELVAELGSYGFKQLYKSPQVEAACQALEKARDAASELLIIWLLQQGPTCWGQARRDARRLVAS